jgi:hypothetical protein
VPDRELVKYLTPALDPKVGDLPASIGALNGVLTAYWRLVRKAL